MPESTISSAKDYLANLRNVLKRIDPKPIDALVTAVYEAWRDDNLVIIFGNGGSASNASHFVADFVKASAVDGCRRLRALSLLDNCALTTAVANDFGYEQSLRYPLSMYGRAGDLAIAISASGNSPNVVAACEWARDNGLKLAAITGFSGGRIACLCDLHIHIPSDNYGLVEDLHLAVGHMVSQAFRAQVREKSEAA
jgi:D-sedoheptulose 7-phosphate isomerase